MILRVIGRFETNREPFSREVDVPTSAHGKRMLARLQKEYGPKSGKSVFYAMVNSGKITRSGTNTERKKKKAGR